MYEAGNGHEIRVHKVEPMLGSGLEESRVVALVFIIHVLECCKHLICVV